MNIKINSRKKRRRSDVFTKRFDKLGSIGAEPVIELFLTQKIGFINP